MKFSTKAKAIWYGMDFTHGVKFLAPSGRRHSDTKIRDFLRKTYLVIFLKGLHGRARIFLGRDCF